MCAQWRLGYMSQDDSHWTPLGPLTTADSHLSIEHQGEPILIRQRIMSGRFRL